MGLFSNSTLSTQDHLDIEDIKEDIVILKDGTVSLVLQTNALNFELLSEKEQDARILSFAGLLNSLDFQMQIVIRTERTDVSSYIDRLKAYRETQISKALRKQIDIYMRFINNLTSNREVLDKSFFVVIPEIIATIQRTSMVKQLFGKQAKIVNKKSILSQAKAKLHPKRDHLIRQFKKMGVVASQMNNDELIRMYYTMYDPDKLGIQKLDLHTTQMTSSLVNLKTQEQAMSQVNSKRPEVK